MKLYRLVVVGLAAAAALAASSGPVLAKPARQTTAPPVTTIAFELRSWGNVLTAWSINADGDGFWTGPVPEPAAAAQPAKPTKHDFSGARQAFAELARMAASLPTPAPGYEPCDNFMTDQPYGIIRLTAGVTTTEIAWNAGCTDPRYLKLLNPLRAMNDKVAEWGRKAPVIAD